MPLERIARDSASNIAPLENRYFITRTGSSEKQQNTMMADLAEISQAGGNIERKINNITPIDYNSYRAVRNFNSRVSSIVVHYTAADFKNSVGLLTRGAVSTHYLVPDPTDPSYHEAGYSDLKIFNLVDEKERAWHAGKSAWRGRNNLNDTSIGIEIVNQAKDDGKGNFIFPPFDPQQISAVKELAANIIQRYPNIGPVNVVGHSDIAIGRKSDPGAAFPWQQLFKAGIGAWYDENTKAEYMEQFSKQLPATKDIIAKMKTYGYDVSEDARGKNLTNAVRAFQLHFRPSDYRGEIDVETVAILYALVEKYA